MPQITLHGYLPNGVAIDIHLENDSFQNALAYSNDMLAAGMLTSPPVNEGLERQLIVTVMRREKSDGTPIIDFYPEWGAANVDTPYGTYKFVHKYLNNDGDVDQFLNASGFKSLQDIPLYDGQAPLKRNIGKSHNKESRVPTPFVVLRKEGKEKIDSEGKPYKPWELVGYEVEPQHKPFDPYMHIDEYGEVVLDNQATTPKTAPQSRQNAPNSSATAQTAQSDGAWNENAQTIVKFLDAAFKTFKLNHGQVIEALRYFSVNPVANVEDYEGTKEQAWAACLAFVCGYDVASVASFPGIAPGMRDLAIEMTELAQVPF